MRSIIGVTLGIVVVGVAFAQSPAEGENTSLVDLLSSEELLGFRSVPDTHVYELKLLSKDAIQKSRAYYAHRRENLAEYRRLQEQHRNLTQEAAKRRLRGEAPGDAEADINSVAQKIEQVSRPTGFFRVAEVTRKGADFIGVQELGGTRELLIPVYRIKHVMARKSGAEQTHSLEPATSSATNGASSPPAR